MDFFGIQFIIDEISSDKNFYPNIVFERRTFSTAEISS